MNGTLVLHNASTKVAILQLIGDAYKYREVVVTSASTGSLRFNFSLDNEVLVRLNGEMSCYQIPRLPFDWVTPTLSGPKVYAAITPEGEIYLYPKYSNEEDFFKNAPTTQPAGFPLKPGACAVNEEDARGQNADSLKRE